MFGFVTFTLLAIGVASQVGAQAPPLPLPPPPGPEVGGSGNGFSNECPPGMPPGPNSHCFQIQGSISTEDLPDIIPDSKKDTGAVLDVGRFGECVKDVKAIAKSYLDIPCLTCNCRRYKGLCWPQKFICSSTVAKYDNPPQSPEEGYSLFG